MTVSGTFPAGRVPTCSESQTRVLGISSCIILLLSYEEQGVTSETEMTRLVFVRRKDPFMDRKVQEVSNGQGSI